MTDTVSPSAPLHFEASFPCDARFREAVADCAAKLSEILAGCCAPAAEVGSTMVQAFEDALVSQAGGEATFEVRVPAGGGLVLLVMAREGTEPVERRFA